MFSGRAYESFVAMERARLLPHTPTAPALRHWRGQHGEEVDVVLENRAGQTVAIEISDERLGPVWWGRGVGVLTTVGGWCTVSFVMVIPLGWLANIGSGWVAASVVDFKRLAGCWLV